MKEMVKKGGIILYGFVIMLLISCSDRHEVETTELKEFYKGYINAILDLSVKRGVAFELSKRHLTKTALEKRGRISASSYTDPLIRAQDVSPDALATLDTRYLTGDWYMVSFYFNRNDSSTLRQIPLKAKMIDGRLQITYVSHFMNGAKYGDENMGAPTRCEESDISQKSELEFLESFYDVYISGYCLMLPEKEIYSKTKSLRERYLSANALAEFKKAEDEYLFDYIDGFDLLIDNFDFDPMWYKSLKIIDMGDSKYQISFFRGNVFKEEIEVTISSTEDGYLIDSIYTESN